MIQVSQPSPSTSESGERGGRSRLAAAGAALAAVAVSATVVLGVAALMGERVRAAVLIADRRVEPAASLRYTDAPQSAAFFDDRDSVTVRVPWEMTRSEFLSLYHLENNASAKAALARELGAEAPDDVLREGDEIRIRLTASRERGGGG